MKRGSTVGTRAVLLVVAQGLFVGNALTEDRAATIISQKPCKLLVVWHDPHYLYPGKYGGVAREVADLFAPLELEMEWRPAELHDPELDENTALLRIILLPSDPAGDGWGLDEDVTAVYLPSHGPARSVYIFYNTLVQRLNIGSQRGRVPVATERRLLDKALGRVVAHEMIHAVAPTMHHLDHGLMRPKVTHSYLARNEFSVSEEVKHAFVAGVHGILTTETIPDTVEPGRLQAKRGAAETSRREN